MGLVIDDIKQLLNEISSDYEVYTCRQGNGVTDRLTHFFYIYRYGSLLSLKSSQISFWTYCMLICKLLCHFQIVFSGGGGGDLK